MRYLLVLLLPACFLFEPAETSSSAMVGRILGPRGTAIRDVKVSSLEARDVTDNGGEFTVAYKSPNQHVDFLYEGAIYQRDYREEDRGERVDIRLPEVRNAAVHCALPEGCSLKLSWDLGEGLSASAVARCGAGEPSAPVLGVPKGVPTAVCRGKTAKEDRPVVIEDAGELWTIKLPPREVRVGVEGDDCQIAIRGVEAEPGNSVRASVSGRSTATAVCGGRPALPALIGGEATEVVLVVPEGVASFTPPDAPRMQPLRLVAEEGPLNGVVMPLPVTESVALPVGLPAGRYRLVYGLQGLVGAPPTPEANTLVIATTGDGWVATLLLDEPLAAGKIASTGP